MKDNNFYTEIKENELAKIEGGFLLEAFIFGFVIGAMAAINEATEKAK
ncbi:MAG: hypothetical protein JG782_1344 [Anaerophaga sp.]|jgi:bacteriocin-like protein|nr:hypothetical protein [Anaerophaga sp.]MDK2841867.1 hypothetical protein [Anaerophaga sp.]